ncbi:MAG: hypothetical protein ACRCTG_14545 [Aestuariivirga sp.]
MILGRKSIHEICGCCGVQADGIGYAPADRKPVLWVCNECLPIARGVYSMTARNMSVFEKTALSEATKATMESQVEAVLAGLWAAGIRNLSDLSPEKLDETLERITLDGALMEAVRQGILAFGDSIRKQCGENQAPF